MQPIVKANSDIHDLTKLSLQQILKFKKWKLLLDLKTPELENNFWSKNIQYCQAIITGAILEISQRVGVISATLHSDTLFWPFSQFIL